MGKSNFKDPNGRHIRVYSTLLNSPAYRVMGFAAKSLFFDLRDKVTSTNNGNISAAMTDLKHKGWASPGTLSNALYELRAMGFLVQTRGGGVEFGSKVCALYRFTDLPALEHPKLGLEASAATHDYQRFQSVAEAEAALRDGVEHLRGRAIERKQQMAERKKTTLQKSYRDATRIVAIEGGERYENRSSDLSIATKIVAEKSAVEASKTRMQQGFQAIQAGGQQ